MARKKKWVYRFGGRRTEGHAEMRGLLGGKGANLAEMCRLKIPVPPGFTITTEACMAFYKLSGSHPPDLKKQVEEALSRVERRTKRRFGQKKNPLLLSVRSGSRASMPGMMDTILNLGLNDETAEALALRTGDKRFVYDSYRRFIQMYSEIVLGVDHDLFEDVIEKHKAKRSLRLDTEMTGEDWEEMSAAFKEKVLAETGRAFPQSSEEHLWGAIGAVFRSWNNRRAKTYRRLHNIPEDWGTAVNIQAMVFGNMGAKSATGVAFTRDPSHGARVFFGEYLLNAQGEDVVAGLRTPLSLTKDAREQSGSREMSLEEAMPKIFKELVAICDVLEKHYRDMQDLEFTIEEGKLWLLQTRAGKRTAGAAVRIATEMAEEGLITEKQAVLRVDPNDLDQLLHSRLDPDAPRDVLTKGLPASPGAACGEVVFSPERAQSLKEQGRRVILVRNETNPEDIHGMHAAEGIVTARGGMTSHAAVVARGMGKPCVSGAGEIRIEREGGAFHVKEREVKEGDILTIDGITGEVMLGAVREIRPEISGNFGQLMSWADKYRRLQVRTNAETVGDVETALEFGAEGIGLCRTEHMFFNTERIAVMREMILSANKEEREKALKKLLPMQRQDFVEIFEAMEGHPVTVRLLDPPLHEFLPRGSEIAPLAERLHVTEDALKRRMNLMMEANPMLGHRGCRLGITYPEIYEMQTRAIFEAAHEVKKKRDLSCAPEIMIPLVAMPVELAFLKLRIEALAEKIEKETGEKPHYQIGTMIELPRAALEADKIAQEADFFSFGTNDLTQMTFGISRDDSGSFMKHYEEQGFFDRDPFVTIDSAGVGALIEIAAKKGRAGKTHLKMGICGEHGGDPTSIALCEEMKLDYVSCSPYRVPIARLAAAQAALRKSGVKP